MSNYYERMQQLGAFFDEKIKEYSSLYKVLQSKHKDREIKLILLGDTSQEKFEKEVFGHSIGYIADEENLDYQKCMAGETDYDWRGIVNWKHIDYFELIEKLHYRENYLRLCKILFQIHYDFRFRSQILDEAINTPNPERYILTCLQNWDLDVEYELALAGGNNLPKNPQKDTKIQAILRLILE